MKKQKRGRSPKPTNNLNGYPPNGVGVASAIAPQTNGSRPTTTYQLDNVRITKGRAQEELDKTLEAIKESKQNRFRIRGGSYWLGGMFDLAIQFAECPPYGTDWVKRHQFLYQFWKRDPWWSGVIKSIASIDANRGWTLTGGRLQVRRYKAVMHNHIVSPDIVGHYAGMEAGSIAFHTADIGCIKELARQPIDGVPAESWPVRGFLCVDPTQARLTYDYLDPLCVNGWNWKQSDYFRVASSVDIAGGNPGYGYCSTSAMMEWVMMAIGIIGHKKEKIKAQLPTGYLLVSGITDDQWEKSEDARKASMAEKGRDWFSGVGVLTSDNPITMTLQSLSELPDNFSEEQFAEIYFSTAGLITGYDTSEFWPVKYGAFGGGTESKVQNQKATAKGQKTFIHRYFEKVQELLPPTLEILPDERDDNGDMLQTQILNEKSKFVMSLYNQGTGIVTLAEARALASDYELIPAEWAEANDEATATDQTNVRLWRERARGNNRARAAAVQFPDDPIIRYDSKTDKELVLFDSGHDLLSKQFWAVPTRRTVGVTRQADKEPRPVQRATVGQATVTDETVATALEQAEVMAEEGAIPQSVVDLMTATPRPAGE